MCLCKNHTVYKGDTNYYKGLDEKGMENLRDKVLEQRNFHYENFNKWSQYFYIIVGALFVGYYTAVANIADTYLQTAIALVGYFVSLGWVLSNKGYYYWVLHWTNFLLDIENHINKTKIYSVFYCTQPVEDDDSNLELDNGSYIRFTKPANVSTPKVAILVSYVIAIVWGMLLCHQITGFCCADCNQVVKWCMDSIIGKFAITLLVTISTLYFLGNLLKSDINKHGYRIFLQKQISDL